MEAHANLSKGAASKSKHELKFAVDKKLAKQHDKMKRQKAETKIKKGEEQLREKVIDVDVGPKQKEVKSKKKEQLHRVYQESAGLGIHFIFILFA